MSADGVEVASRFLVALEAAVRTGDREPVYSMLTSDVEWVIPQRTLHGVEELREKLIWGFPPAKFEVEFEDGDWVDLGEGRLAVEVREVYRWRETGEIAHRRDRRIEVAIRDGQVSRYSTRVLG